MKKPFREGRLLPFRPDAPIGTVLAVIQPYMKNIERPWEVQREHRARQQTVINEIHFTHDRMSRLMRAMTARETKGPIGDLITAQHAHHLMALRGIISLALDLGAPPGPCVCAEGAALVEAVYTADRAPRADVNRALRIMERLLEVHRYVIGLWSRLADELKLLADDVELYRTAIKCQTREADLHRSLVRAIAGIQGGSHESGAMRSA